MAALLKGAIIYPVYKIYDHALADVENKAIWYITLDAQNYCILR